MQSVPVVAITLISLAILVVSVGCFEAHGRSKQTHLVWRLQRRIKKLERLLRSKRTTLCRSQGLSEDENGIYARLQVAKNPFDKNFAHLAAAPGFFYIEVGTNTRDLLLDHMQAAFSHGAFLLAFEPLLDKYAALMSRFGGAADQWSRLGFQHERSLVLPFAVGCRGVAPFHVTPVDGCSSLLPPRGDEFAKDPHRRWWEASVESSCARSVDERHVPCVSLEHVIGNWLGGRDVEHLKIDAQGLDLEVVRSAGRYIDRLKTVLLEVTCDTVANLYHGALNCSTVHHEMLRLGFTTTFDVELCKRCVEADVFFVRPDARWLPPLNSLRVVLK